MSLDADTRPPNFEASRTVQNVDLGILAAPDNDEFANDVPTRSKECHDDDVKMHVWSVDVSQLCFLHTCSGLRFLASTPLILDFVMPLCWFSAS